MLPQNQYNAKAWIRTSVLISPEFYTACKKNQIRFSEAMKVGISMLLAERGVVEYDNKLNLVRNLLSLKLQLRDSMEKTAKWETQTTSKEEKKSIKSAGNSD